VVPRTPCLPDDFGRDPQVGVGDGQDQDRFAGEDFTGCSRLHPDKGEGLPGSNKMRKPGEIVPIDDDAPMDAGSGQYLVSAAVHLWCRLGIDRHVGQMGQLAQAYRLTVVEPGSAGDGDPGRLRGEPLDPKTAIHDRAVYEGDVDLTGKHLPSERFRAARDELGHDAGMIAREGADEVISQDGRHIGRYADPRSASCP